MKMNGEHSFEALRLFWREDFRSRFLAADEIDQERVPQPVIEAPFF